MPRRYYGFNRSLCSVLEEMRKCYETYNFAILRSLIEEAQVIGNRMEAGLADKKDLARLTEDRSKLKNEIRELEAEAAKLRALVGKKEKEE